MARLAACVGRCVPLARLELSTVGKVLAAGAAEAVRRHAVQQRGQAALGFLLAGLIAQCGLLRGARRRGAGWQLPLCPERLLCRGRLGSGPRGRGDDGVTRGLFPFHH